MLRTLLLLIVLALSPLATADDIATLSPRHKPAAELLPVLQQAFPDAAFSVFYQQLIVRAPDRATLARIEALLAELDTVTRQFRLSVEQRQHASAAGWHFDTSGRVVIRNGKAGGALAVSLGQFHSDSRLLNRSSVLTLDGQEAWISLGQSRFYPLRTWWPGSGVVVSGGEWASVGNGFVAQPLAQGREVVVRLSPQLSRFVGGRRIERAGAYTEVRASPGEWLLIGESNSSSQSSTAGWPDNGSERGQGGYQVWLRVDED
ncbi:hypothetical protein [Chitinilyticum litopenaei]|uniref:hypothetical protein n=1 Tax=Chitinilyticum litopenaei TaxID=1121276 RepID=UPI00040EAE5C|nr:hypothetical protein [Chitinilyticum litopenaei]